MKYILEVFGCSLEVQQFSYRDAEYDQVTLSICNTCFEASWGGNVNRTINIIFEVSLYKKHCVKEINIEFLGIIVVFAKLQKENFQ